MFAALNTVEPPILELVTAKILEGDRPWAQARLPLVKDRIRDRLIQLSVRLSDAEWLDGPFSAGDLMMVSVLLRLRPSGLLDEFSELAGYVSRGEARPAYQRAFAAQWAINAADPPAGGRTRPWVAGDTAVRTVSTISIGSIPAGMSRSSPVGPFHRSRRRPVQTGFSNTMR
jgi:hypothetical protein